MTPLPPHRTPGERRAAASAATAIARAQAHLRPPPPDPDPWDGAWPPTPTAWRLRCRQIREELDADRGATR